MSRQAIPCALLLLTAVAPCAIADQPGRPPPPPGYHDVKVGKAVVRVRDESTPTDTSHNLDLGKTSSLANKSFSTSFASLSKDDRAAESQADKHFDTHSFATAEYNQAGSKYKTTAYNESSRQSSSLSKPYVLPPANSESSQTFLTKGSDLQGKKALLAESSFKKDPFAAPDALNEKSFFDPNLKHVQHDPYASNFDVKRLADLPNRPLTIREVRNLINHEQVPDLSTKPDADSVDEVGDLPLNDPKWEPPTRAPRGPSWAIPGKQVPTAPPAELEKNGELPPPGEMSQPPPENSEPLPK